MKWIHLAVILFVTSVWAKDDLYLQPSNQNALITSPGPIAKAEQYGLQEMAFFGGQYFYQATQAGYFSLHSFKDGAPFSINLFVSPMPSKHNDRQDMDWYRTQFNSGTPSNCGPASTAMAVAWATGKEVDVYDIRKLVGWSGRGANNPQLIQKEVAAFMSNQEGNIRNGGTSYQELLSVLQKYQVKANYAFLKSGDELFDLLEKGSIALVLMRAGDISLAGPNLAQDQRGRYYDYLGGHYIIVKGYSYDKKYLIVYDPMPSDWSGNTFRYHDNSSMIGRNRYYRTSELLPSIRNMSNTVLEISR